MQNTKIKTLLHTLIDGNFHSGASLGKTLGVTRSAVWKLIHQLQEITGIEIEARTNQGYRMEGNIELLDIHKIKAYLSQRYHPYLDKTAILDQIASTNTYLLEKVQQKDNDTYICLAEMQTAGRGRFHRHWLSPFGSNIYLSLLWHFKNDVTQLSGLSLALAVSIVRTLKKYGVQDEIAVKWPNDLSWHGRKLGGVLVELRGEFNHHCEAVIGVGLNLHMPKKLANSVDFAMVDLTEITKSKLNRNKLVGLLLEELLDSLAVFQEQGLKPFMKEFHMLDHTLDKPVKIVHDKDTFYGVSRGIDEKGCFLLEDKQGKVQSFICGEATLRLRGS